MTRSHGSGEGEPRGRRIGDIAGTNILLAASYAVFQSLAPGEDPKETVRSTLVTFEDLVQSRAQANYIKMDLVALKAVYHGYPEDSTASNFAIDTIINLVPHHA